jgi:hypothetical protein
MKEYILLNFVLFGEPSRAKQIAGHSRLRLEGVINEDLKEMGTSWEALKREALNRVGWRRNMHNCFDLWWLGTAASC